MIISRYTEPIQDLTGNYYLFNCLTRKWICLDPKLYDMVLQYHDKIEVIESIHPDFFILLSGKKRQNHIFSTNITSYTCFTKKGLSFEAM